MTNTAHNRQLDLLRDSIKKPPRRILVLASLFVVALLGFVVLAPRLNVASLDEGFFQSNDKLLLVFAHADDEVTNAGFIRAAALRGAEVRLITLTDGSANPSSDLSRCPDADIVACRLAEIRLASSRLGVKELLTPMFPDSVLASHEEEAVRFVSDELERFSPNFLLTMEHSGLNGLDDHKAAHRIAVNAARRAGAQGIKVILSTLPFPFDVFLPSEAPAHVRARRQHFILSDRLTTDKVSVAKAHASQWKTIQGLTLGLGPHVLFRWMNRERYFILPLSEL